MEKEISVIVCSRETSEEKKEFIQQIRDTCGCPTHVYFLVNKDGIGLTQVYNGILESDKVENNILVFIHDDVEFLRKGWGNELLRLFNSHKDYGIIGVAGSAQFDEKGAWWQYNNKYGQVLHRHNGKSWLTTFSPLLDHDLEEVCVIDGLFMAVDRQRISKHFDASITGFDMYDIDFCLANYLDGKTKIGVTTNIRIAHNSIGELKPSWYENLRKVVKKYGKYFPIEVNKNGRKKSD